MLVPKANGKVWLCLDPAHLNQELRPIHRGPGLNNILPKLSNAKYISFIDMSSGYHDLKLELKIFILHDVCVPIWEIQVQMIKICSTTGRGYEIFKNLPNVFSIADDILVVGS